jgi:hypothetical protein
MIHSLLALGRLAATIALVATMAVGFASVARADDWARDHVATQAFTSLDPAIRTAINGRNLDAAPPAAAVVVSTPVGDEGFAWGAAALGVGIGVAAVCAVLACVTLVRHDGRLRSA